MPQPAQLRVIIADHDVRKVVLPSGIPETLDDLHSVIRDTFSIAKDFSLHYKDEDFDEFFTLLSTTDLKDKDTIKVVFLPNQEPPIILTLTDVTNMNNQPCEEPDVDDTASVSTDDTLILSSEDSPGHRSQRWPAQFSIPSFSGLTEIQIQSGNERFNKYMTLLTTKDLIPLLPDILGKLAEAIYEYTAYPSSLQISEVAEALTQKHPCLKEPGSFNGSYGWAQRLKYKMNNFRSKLRGLGCPEVEVNSLKRKQTHDQYPAKNLKKPKKAEVNYLPPHAQGETTASLEKERVELLSEMMKRDNSKVVAQKMAKTFSLRREEIVKEAPAISECMKRWPALFSEAQISEEFKRITTVNLQSTFLAKLDQCTPKLMALTQSKGGAAGLKIRNIKDMLLEDNTVERQREIAIRCLMVYLGEKEEDLFKQYWDVEELDADLAMQVMKIAIIGDGCATIVVEGTKILQGIDVARSCALLMGVIYALNLRYPKQLKFTFEAFQKLCLELDGQKASSKVMNLKYGIF
ncbi:sterile alpha motif domain-containing protein 3-like isoform X2 [Solea solea]|nr:sterile alpha motif domain-containing protein 3-like isoform X2 [Solea solea]XP_058481855.1 sterile alpha motif domain-containing protein 3-like isoform X2 [Solea solea]XP_058481856.1 sterile alpha motif domain-containing protein 3-like isoform X2 [Solea solea]XP_058497309.1 sterile alpha motif domain-containing protein 3-like isoform X2 [Solea solea]XP_058497310.1 sterile alpha motif domain-containing protein 3-like isoform X2 [Solea solea]XP_058497311.1 sterile alpha motif domain-containi